MEDAMTIQYVINYDYSVNDYQYFFNPLCTDGSFNIGEGNFIKNLIILPINICFHTAYSARLNLDRVGNSQRQIFLKSANFLNIYSGAWTVSVQLNIYFDTDTARTEPPRKCTTFFVDISSFPLKQLYATFSNAKAFPTNVIYLNTLLI